jgi:hypothetical protein
MNIIVLSRYLFYQKIDESLKFKMNINWVLTLKN